MIIGVMCAVMSVANMMGQVIREGEMAVVYYMPKTELVIDIEYETVILHRGIFVEYAKQYLGKTDVVNEDGISYRITAIRPRIKTVADNCRMHKVSDQLLLSLTPYGTLAAYNIDRSQSLPTEHKPASHNRPQSQIDKPNVLPLLEEHIVGKSIADQARGAAKMIYRIRENRLYLIGGEVDKMPSDGASMEIALKKMDELEQQLVELFVGRIEVEKHHKTITYTPLKSEETEIAFFSEQSGFTTAVGNGEPITLSITARRQTKGNPNTDRKKEPTPSQIYYNLPGSATYKISYQNEVYAEREIPVAQFGVSVPLAQDLFNTKEQPRILFNKQTGNIESIER